MSQKIIERKEIFIVMTLERRKYRYIYIYIKQIIFFLVMILCCCGLSKKAWANTVLFQNNTFLYYEASAETYDKLGYSYGNNSDWGNGDFDNPDIWSNNTKVLYLTKDQILKWKAGDQIIFQSSDFDWWQKDHSPCYYHENFTANATLYVTDKNTSYATDKNKFGTAYSFTMSGGGLYGTTILTLNNTPSVPNDAVALYRKYTVTSKGSIKNYYYLPLNYSSNTYIQDGTTPYYGKLVISVKFSFCTDRSDGGVGGVGKIKRMYVSDSVIHQHNSNGTDYNQGNDNQHIKYTFCDGHGSDKSQNRNSTWENHTWTHTNSTTDTCSKCGRTKIRLYYTGANYLNVSAMNPNDQEDQHSGQFKFSRDGINWSDWATDQIQSYVQRFQYGEKLYIRFQPYYDYYELRIAEIEHKPDSNLAKESGKQEWTYTVIKDSPPQGILFRMDYKHTTLALDPNGGMINGSSDKQALSPQMQYSMSNWWSISGKKPTRPGYTFEGWYDAATGGTKVYDTDGKCIRGTKYWDSNGNSLCVNDLTVYAHWKINTYNIYYTLYGSNASLQRTYTVESNNFALPTNPTLQGYIFKGWIGGIDQKDPVKKGTTYQSPTKNVTVEKGSYGDYFFRAIFEKIPSVDQIGNRTDDVYIAQSVPHEKQY